MDEEASRTERPRPVAALLAAMRLRLAGRRATLAAAALVLFWLAAFQHLDPLDALIGAGVVLLAALFVPRSADFVTPAANAEDASAALRLGMASRFADALPDPCLILDRRSIVLHRNGAAAIEFPNAIVGNPLGLALRNPALTGAIDAARLGDAAQTVELHQTVPNETWHKVAIAPLAEDDGAASGLLVITLQNLTDQKRIDAMRRDFIANASHELRTPLTSLVGFIDTLLGPAAKDAEARERFLTIMHAQAGRMSKLIDDLLSLNRIEMRQHVRPTGSVDLGSLLAEVREGLQTQAKAAGVMIDLAVPAEPATIIGDRDELYEVFENLLDNAIKYGGDGGKVEIALEPAGSRPGYDYAVSVVDHGAGIEAVHVPRLTERFYRVDAESSRRKKGTGLGLAIVKHIINRHRGTLSIRSQPGEGTRVEVLLPR